MKYHIYVTKLVFNDIVEADNPEEAFENNEKGRELLESIKKNEKTIIITRKESFFKVKVKINKERIKNEEKNY